MAQVADFALLGPLAVRIDRRPVHVGGWRACCVLAALLLDANHVVPVTRLMEAAWGDEPPPTARVQVQNRVSALRRLLRSGSGRELIERAGSGYVIRLADDELDLTRFQRRVARADSAHARGDLRAAHGEVVAALALWRGPALDGLPTPQLEAAARHLEEQRLGVLEKRIEIDLALGRHAEVIGELGELADANQYRERLHALLMLSLYRAGRPAEALAQFRRVRKALTEQLGVEPSPLLQRLHEAVLQVDDRLLRVGLDHLAVDVAAPATVRRVPHELPADIGGFVGRAGQLAALNGLPITGTDRVGVVVISGTAGVGKTVLAVHWAHLVADRFPDGQLYLNLRGYSPDAPMRPIEALAALLRSLGTAPERVPVAVDEAAAMYRSLLADRRMLVLLDNAGSVDQVRPLLPGGAGCVVLVTGRDRLSGLAVREGAWRLELPVLSPGEAAALLARVLGPDRVRAEPAAAAELAEVCAYLPLAVRIAAANLGSHAHHRIADHVARLRNGNRLAALEVEGDQEAAVGATFDLSYRSIPPPSQRMFRLLGLAPGDDVTIPAAAALADVPPTEAVALLERLADAHLVDEHAAGRYTLHDLLRRYAAERCTTVDRHPDRQAALDRLFEYYLTSVAAAAAVLYPRVMRLSLPDDLGPSSVKFDSPSGASAWLDGERTNLVTAVVHAAAHGPRRMAWLLADAMRGYFYLRMDFVDWLAATQAALVAAEAAGDRQARAALHLGMAALRFRQSDYPATVANGTEALDFSRASGWWEGEVSALNLLGLAHWQSGELGPATDVYTQALDRLRPTGHVPRQALVLTNLGLVHWQRGQLERAAEYHREAVRLHRQSGSDYAIGLANLGRAVHDLGRSGPALRYLTDALAQHRDSGDRGGEAYTCHTLATVYCDTGGYTRAGDLAGAAVELTRETDNRYDGATALNVLASVHHGLGDRSTAIDLHGQALELARSNGMHYAGAVALTGLAEAFRPDRLDDAAASATEALDIALRHGYRVLEAHALLALAAIAADRGDATAATGRAGSALTLYRETGHRRGAAGALALLRRSRPTPVR